MFDTNWAILTALQDCYIGGMSTPDETVSAAEREAATIPLSTKKSILSDLSEDEFRDKVVRPLFHRMGFGPGRDLCGPDEEGKDTYFVTKDLFGQMIVYAVQTKKGKLNLTRKASENLLDAKTQVRTALETRISIGHQKPLPSVVILCASGEINKPARDYICNELNDPRIQFMDSEELIPFIDKHFPEYWYNIDAEAFPYMRTLKDQLLSLSDSISFAEIGCDDKALSPITDDTFINLALTQFQPIVKRRLGEVTLDPKYRHIHAQDILKERDLLMWLEGDAGTGKTTTLRRIAYMITDTALRNVKVELIPILMRATDICDPVTRLVEEANNATRRLTHLEKPSFSAENLEKGQVVILIDALDEVAEKSDQELILDKIDKFHAEWPKCRVILTSRRNSQILSLSYLEGMSNYQISKFGLPQAHKLASRLLSGRRTSEVNMQEMLRRLQDVHGIELNPLLVTIFVAASDINRRDIPANITELFKKFTEMMLGRWDQKKGLAQQHQYVLKDFLLQQVALRMHLAKVNKLPLDLFLVVIHEELSTRGLELTAIESLLNEITERSGLVRIENGSVRFRHMLLQEFFAGRGASSAQIQDAVTDPWWTKPIIFHFGESPDRYSALKSIVESLATHEGGEMFQAATSAGLALQACYLAKTAERELLLTQIVKALAASKDGFVEPEEDGKNPMLSFLHYYLVGRDAVSCKETRNVLRMIQAETGTEAEGTEEEKALAETVLFWCFVGIIESGFPADVEDDVRRFDPIDLRLLMGITLGCIHVSQARYEDPANKKIADRMVKTEGKRVAHLLQKVGEEFKGLILEMREGSMKVLDKTESPAIEATSAEKPEALMEDGGPGEKKDSESASA